MTLHTDEKATCPTLDQPNNYHFEGYCEDCDVQRLSRLPLGAIEDLYCVGRVSQDLYEAYRHVWAALSPSRSHPEWRPIPQDPNVRRAARKFLRARDFDVPAALDIDTPTVNGHDHV